jgi:predicted PurR-regulated permease PerM
MPENSGSRKRSEFGKLIGLAYLVVALAAFSWAKEFLLPIILAMLISFLLTPVVSNALQQRLLAFFPGALKLVSQNEFKPTICQRLGE